MARHSDKLDSRARLREKILGFGETSLRKSYYPELQRRLLEIQESEQRFRNIVRSSPIGMYLYELDPDGNLILIDSNPAADRATGIDNQQLIGKTLEEAFPGLVNTEVPERYKAAAAEGTPWQTTNFTYQGLGVDGLFDVYAFQTSPGRMAAVFMDISHRQRLEEQLRQSQKMESIGRLAGGIAHDFNNMLAGIMGAAELLDSQLKDDPKRSRYVRLITDAAKRAAGLTDQLLSFSRKRAVSSAPLDFHAVVHNGIELLTPSIDPRIQLNCDLAAENATVNGDSPQLQNIILNLGLNAAAAMPKGGRIDIITENVCLDQADCQASAFDLIPGRFLLLSFSDTGGGIAPDTMEHIFEPFFTTKAAGKGTGLGLATVYGTVQSHNGAITVHSEPGMGTVFRIYLPLSDQAPDSPISERQTAVRGTGCILLVDDEPMILTTAQFMLKELGYKVILARDGLEGLETYRHRGHQIDLVILDMAMPRMNGADCFRAIRRLNPRAKVLMSSGFAVDNEIADLGQEGLLGFIKKPYQRADFSRILADMLARPA